MKNPFIVDFKGSFAPFKMTICHSERAKRPKNLSNEHFMVTVDK